MLAIAANGTTQWVVVTRAVIALERELGGALFQRKPAIALTALGQGLHPYLQRIAENADLARDIAQSL
jgi:DNA-binding transcriptional LysR family regulator